MNSEQLDERSKQILHAVISSYINRPDPVGSRFVTKKFSFGFSSATIRNIMADLEELGFLFQPHTSAGRVPTDKGYRFYVDILMGREFSDARENLGLEFRLEFTSKLEKMRDDFSLVFREVTNTLSSLSHYIGVVLPPKTERITFRRIDLIKYRGDRIVALLLTEEGIVKNKTFSIPQPVDQADLNRISDYLNGEFQGRPLDDIRNTLVMHLHREKKAWDSIIERAIAICENALTFSENELFVSGIYDVLDLPDFSDLARIREISRALKEKHIMLRLLEELSAAEGVRIIIGDENPISEMKKLSVVAAPYREGTRPIGLIALIGPTRMNYMRAVSMVDTIAQCVSDTFRE